MCTYSLDLLFHVFALKNKGNFRLDLKHLIHWTKILGTSKNLVPTSTYKLRNTNLLIIDSIKHFDHFN